VVDFEDFTMDIGENLLGVVAQGTQLPDQICQRSIGNTL
jgi:hypothetical protein